MITLLTLLFSIPVSGKTGFNKRVAQYYKFKNLAEVCIIDSAYQDAAAYYKKAFLFKYPNDRDLYNAFAVVYLMHDSTDAKLYINRIIINGQTKDKFEMGRFVRTVKGEPFYSWLIKDYDSLKKVADTGSQKRLATWYDAIIDEDQNIRFKFPPQSKPTKAQVLELLSVDSANIKNTIALIDKYGFPSYERVGLFEKVREGYINGYGSIWLLLWHSKKSNLSLNNAVEKAVMNGEYPADEFSLILDMQADSSVYFSVLPRKVNDSGQYIFQPLPDTRLINERRASLYLELVEDYIRKLEYDNNANNKFYLIPTWGRMLNYAPMDFRQWSQ